MSGRGYISPEKDGACDFCKKVEELRPYGPNGERICFECAMKDEEATSRRFRQVVIGDGFDA